MKISELQYLTEKYLKNDIKEDEHKRLNLLLKEKENAFIFKGLVQDDYIMKTENRHFDVEKGFSKITSSLEKSTPKKVFRIPSLFKYAAGVVVLMSLGLLFRNLNSNSDASVLTDKSADKQIRLILNDGSEQLLTNSKIDSVKGNDNAVVGISNKGKLHYLDAKRDNTIAYNSLHVPYGKTFQLILADGSKVHLNAGSSLRYPTSFFKTEQRAVFLTGEAFFEVSKNPNKKFIVKTGNHDVEVLGTEFNVSAYEDNDNIKTTLREGSVKVLNGENQILLVPNEQSSWNKTDQKLEKQLVDVTQFTAWIDGQKVFKAMSFAKIIKQLERTYDVKIVNNNTKLINERFTARFEEESIEQIMDYLSQSYPFKYRKDGRTITIN